MSSNKLANLAAATVIVAAVFIAYFPSITGDFIWDDDQHLVEDPFMEKADGWRRIWFAPERYVWNYWPVTRSSFWLERRIWGLNPVGYRLVNLALHSLNALLLWKILASLGVPGAWFAALLFAIHPVNVETVAWITQRKNTLSMFFYLLAIRWYLDFDRRNNKGFYAASLAAFALSLLSKTATVTLPAVLLLIALWKGRPSLPDAFRRLAPYFLLALAAGLASVWFEKHYIGSGGPEFQFSAAERVILAGRVFWFYLGKTLWPHPLIFVYPRWAIDPGMALSWLPLLALAAVLAFFFFKRRRWGGGAFFALAYFAVSLFPVSGLEPLWRDTLKKNPSAWMARINLGRVLMAEKEDHEAIRHFDHAIQLYPDDPETTAYRNRGISFSELREYDLSLADFNRALMINPINPDVYYHRGNLFRHRGDLAGAINDWDRAIRINPAFTDAYLNRGNASSMLGDTDGSLADFYQTIELKPDYAEAHFNLGVVLESKGEIEAALESYNRAIELNPRKVDFYCRRGKLYLETGNPDRAEEDLREMTRRGYSRKTEDNPR